MNTLDYKPDAIILFSGHNEFHARYGWSRNVAHYQDEGLESLLGLQELARSISATTHEIFRNLDRFYGEAPPPPHISRELVDHPSLHPARVSISSRGVRAPARFAGRLLQPDRALADLDRARLE